MKKKMMLVMTVMILVMGGAVSLMAQKPKQVGKARDLYIDHAQNENQGQPGAKVAIELLRKGESESTLVSPQTVFHSGDRIRLVIDLNFTGYIALVNVGTSGKESLLFPYKGADDQVAPNAALRVPRTDWIKFDNTVGTEELIVAFSKNRIPEVEQYLNGGSSTPTQSTGGQANPSEQDQVLADLNSRGLKMKAKAKGSRDLSIESANDATYCVANDNKIKDVVAFSLKLAHQ